MLPLACHPEMSSKTACPCSVRRVFAFGWMREAGNRSSTRDEHSKDSRWQWERVKLPGSHCRRLLWRVIDRTAMECKPHRWLGREECWRPHLAPPPSMAAGDIGLESARPSGPLRGLGTSPSHWNEALVVNFSCETILIRASREEWPPSY
jgi:hypothetical protein